MRICDSDSKNWIAGIEDIPMKTLRRNNIKLIAEVLSKILAKRRRIMEEKNKPVTKKKTRKEKG